MPVQLSEDLTPVNGYYRSIMPFLPMHVPDGLKNRLIRLKRKSL